MSEYLISREDQVYMDIESCKSSYELRYVIAYEMAIRNKEIQKLLKKTLREDKEDKASKTLKLKYGFTDYAIAYYSIRNIGIDRLGSSKKKSLSSISQKKLEKTQKSDLVTEVLCFPKEAVILNNTPIVMDEIPKKANIEDHKYFNKLSIDIRLLRPKLKPVSDKRFYVEINFQLPESEIIEYIKRIKQQYDKHVIKGKIEMLTPIRTVKAKVKKENPQKYADMLYIYDYFKKCNKEDVKFKSNGKQYEHMSEALYYSFAKEDRNVLSRNTIEKYIKDMESYIQDLKYIELLTGISHLEPDN